MIHYPSMPELKKALGGNYTIRVIDWEKCLYRDFGNGFNVEVSGCSRANRKGSATLYLWYGDDGPASIIVKTVRGIGRSADEIHAAVENLYAYSQWLIAHGYNSRDRLYNLKNIVYESEELNHETQNLLRSKAVFHRRRQGHFLPRQV